MLLLPLAEAGRQGLFIVPELIPIPADNVPILAQVWSHLPFSIPQGTALVQALPLRGPKGESSSSPFQIAFVSQDIQTQKPLREYVVAGRKFQGLLDTGADVSVIDSAQWPIAWPLESSPSVWGVGGESSARQSRKQLPVFSPASGALLGHIQPVVVPLGINLWGRDLLTQLNAQVRLDE